MPASARAAVLNFLTGSDHFDLFVGDISVKTDGLLKSKIFRCGCFLLMPNVAS
jgi:hypothetical protein